MHPGAFPRHVGPGSGRTWRPNYAIERIIQDSDAIAHELSLNQGLLVNTKATLPKNGDERLGSDGLTRRVRYYYKNRAAELARAERKRRAAGVTKRGPYRKSPPRLV